MCESCFRTSIQCYMIFTFFYKTSIPISQLGVDLFQTCVPVKPDLVLAVSESYFPIYACGVICSTHGSVSNLINMPKRRIFCIETFLNGLSWVFLYNFAIVFRFDENQLWAIKIKGSAFLWHQVRCMVAVLFLIGQGHESPDVRTKCLLDWVLKFLYQTFKIYYFKIICFLNLLKQSAWHVHKTEVQPETL